MIADRWDSLSAWLNAWIAADAAERERLRARLAADAPDLVAEAQRLTEASDHLLGFLETPAIVLEARELALDDQLLPAGSMVGPYRVTSLLARGGMGDVYRATDTRLHRDVALKVLAQSRTGDPRRVERFMQEARLTASLDDPNVVRVFDVGRVDDRAYLVAELLEGETLRTRIERGPIGADEAVRIGLEVAGGLVAASAAGLVHRDLKPDNIFLTRSGATKILDFGIAKLAQDDSVRDGFSTLTGVVLGTAGYLSPEQIKGEAVDSRADLFALGAVLFEMLAGTRAFARPHLVETLHAILHDSPTSALAERLDVPASLVAIVMRLLEKSPDARFDSPATLIEALERVDLTERGAPRVVARQPGPKPEERVSARRLRARPISWLAVAVAGVGLMAWASWYAGRSRPLTLAVMPFQTFPASSGNELLEAGLAGAFINRLGQLSELRVLPLTATMRLRTESDQLEAARRLGATHILTGTLQRDRDVLRSTVELRQTSDHRTVLAIPPFDSDRSRIFEIQDLIVTRVLEQLLPKLAMDARTALGRAGTENSQAYESYLLGQGLVTNPTSRDLLKAAEHFEQALKLDPEYADAWAGLGSAYKRMPVTQTGVPDAFEKARTAALRALELEPEHPEALSVLGTVAFWYDWNYAESERLLRRALALHPSSTDAQVFLAHLLSNLGRHDEALDEIHRARALDPGWPIPRNLQGQFLFMARRYEESVRHLDAMIRIEPPGTWPSHVMRAYPLIALERYDEAIQECDRVAEIRRRTEPGEDRFTLDSALRAYALARKGEIGAATALVDELGRRGTSATSEAIALLGLGRQDEALSRLRAGVERRELYVTFLGVDPKFDELRGNPVFRELLSKVNLLEVSDKRR